MRSLRWAFIGVNVLVYGFILSAVVFVVLLSFSPSAIFRIPPEGVSLVWYRRMLTYEPFFESLQLSVEVTAYGYRSTGSTFFGGFASIGPTFHTGDSPLGGFFVTPKLAFDALHESTRNRSGAAFMAGVDAGWQKSFGRFYLAFVLGVTAGWSFADADWFQGPGFNGPPGFGPDPARPVVGLNMNLVRLGIAL